LSERQGKGLDARDDFDFLARMLHGAGTMTAEEERTRLIGDIARVLRDGPVPEETRAAALTLIGWLARRMPGEPVSVCDLNRCRGYAARHGQADASADVSSNDSRATIPDR
jgi:hypothetical protein